MDQFKAIVEAIVIYFLQVLEYFEFEGVDVDGFTAWLEEQKNK